MLVAPEPKSIFYQDDKIYACLASYPISKGHSIVAWKENVTDLHLLSKQEYEYLMGKVDSIRNALMKALKVNKVYLMYMDEAKHVHWHLIPRYNVMGFNLLKHHPNKLISYKTASEIKKYL